MESSLDMKDHDLLVTLHEQMKEVKAAIRELKDGTSDKLTSHEIRINKLETSNAKYFLTVAIYSAIGATMTALIIYHILQG